MSATPSPILRVHGWQNDGVFMGHLHLGMHRFTMNSHNQDVSPRELDMKLEWPKPASPDSMFCLR